MNTYKTKKFYDVYDKLIKNYNNSVHWTLQLKPVDVDEEQEQKISDNKRIEYDAAKLNIKLKIGDYVRILKIKK